MEIEFSRRQEKEDEVVEVTSRPPPPQPAPWLIFFSREENQDRQTFYSLMEDKCYERNISHTAASKCMALTNGWMLMSEENNGMRCSLINLVKFEEIDLPPPRQSFSELMISGVLTAPPSNPKSTLLFISSDSPHIIYNNVGGDKRWVSKKYSMGDDEENDDMLLETMVVCRRKIFAMSKTGLFTVKIMKKRIALRSVVPSFPWKVGGMRIDQLMLVECLGELFLIVHVYFGLTKDENSFSVYKMDFGNWEWKEVNNLGDRAFFFSSNGLGCAWCSSVASKLVKKNSIYYVGNDNKYRGIFRYDMRSCSISIDHLPLPEAYDSNIQVGWINTI